MPEGLWSDKKCIAPHRWDGRTPPPPHQNLRLQDARKRAKDCSGPLETDLRWKEIFAYEQGVIDKKMSDYDLERQVGTSGAQAASPFSCRAPIIIDKHLWL
jgi:hypothetical protein